MSNPNSISAYIRRAYDEATIRSGASPVALYLGIEEDEALTILCQREYGYRPTNMESKGFERTFMGMRVYRVLVQSHIGVSL